MNEHKATQTKQLPQYINSDYITEKFLESIHDDKGEIKIAKRYDGIKVLGKEESVLDGLEFFLKHKKCFENEFYAECKDIIGRKKTFEFLDIISNVWYDGRNTRLGKDIYPLFYSIEKYFVEYKRINKENILSLNKPDFFGVTPLFEPRELDDIFQLNNRLIGWCLNEYISTFNLNFSTNDIYFRRGIVVSKGFNNDKEFLEQNFINSYTLSCSVSEQFCQIKDGQPILLNIDFNNSMGRMLFFSPFIRNMNQTLKEKNYEQLEIGLIPPFAEMKAIFQDKHDNVMEYLLEYETEYD